MISKTISHYKILEKLGEGGMGQVYKAEDTKLKRTVALKFLPKDFSRDPEAKKRFMEEARSSSHLDHNNICVIHDIKETDDGQLFIIMNYYQGETLQNIIKEKDLTIKEVLKYIIQIAKGLEKAHSKGIVHCDIKPTNIIITDDGVAKILDFGIAKIASEEKLISKDRTSGTIAYMSPEQVSNATIDTRTDIWSLGVVFYEMLTKQQPFADSYNEALMYSIMNEEPKSITSINSNVQPELELIILKMLSKNPDKRNQKISNLLSDLKKSQKEKLSKSIAVLPFSSIGDSKESGYFCDGMHDDILLQVAKIHDLKVVSRTSVMRYKDTDKSIIEIAQELGVETILEGSVRRVGGRVRIVAQLINAKTDDHLWAETYDRDYVDIFAIQTDVAENIASALKATLTPEEISTIEIKPTENMEAYDYYLKGKYYWDTKTDREGRMKAAELFEKAVELDPNFTLAYAWLAKVDFALYKNVNLDRFKSTYWDPTPERLEKGKSALEKAIQLDPDYPEVHFAQASYYSDIEDEHKKAVIEYLKALEGQPNDSEINRDIGTSYMILGEWDKAEQYLLKAYEVDPHGMHTAGLVATFYMHMRDWQKSEYYINKAIVSFPEQGYLYGRKSEIAIFGYGDTEKATRLIDEGVQFAGERNLLSNRFSVECRSGRFQELLETYERFPDDDTYFLSKGIVYRFLGEEDQAKTSFDSAKVVHERWVQTVPHHIQNYGYLGLVYAGLGRKEEAIKSAQKAIELEPISKNALSAPYNHLELAYVYSMVGEQDKALDEIELILSIPFYLTTWDLKLDPIWDPLRDNLRFQELIEKYKATEG